jgi:nucleoside-diphosphate-sugar epimerase
VINKTISIAIIFTACFLSGFSYAGESLKNDFIIFGASRGIGLALATQLVGRGDGVTAFVRPTSDLAALQLLGVSLLEGDALNQQQVEAAFQGVKYTAVITTIGCFKCDSPPDYIGNKNIFDAAVRSGNQRIIMVSTLGAGDSYEALPFPAKWFLNDTIELKNKAESHLITLTDEYTIIRPAALIDGEASGKGVLSEVAKSGVISRADVADLIVQSLDDDQTRGKIFVVFDSEKSWPWDIF